MNDGQYLELCNDLKKQYEDLKNKFEMRLVLNRLEKIKLNKKIIDQQKIIANKNELILHLKRLLQSEPCKNGQFDTIRPSADYPRYTHVMGMMSDFDYTIH
tara:strand:+ start:755 stop:1057 length:303 start_codon:yes stop_codon:yes gene_type:complete